MFNIAVSITDEASPVLRRINRELSPARRRQRFFIGRKVLLEELKQYHRDFGNRGGWENKGGLAHTRGPGKRRKTGFAKAIVRAWKPGRVTPTGFSIHNDHPLLSHKIEGGPITAKRAPFLTIPIVKQAHGRSTMEYRAIRKRALFQVKGKQALFEKVGKTEIRAIYALKKEVDQDPVPGAMPTGAREKKIIDRVTGEMLEGLDRAIDS